MMDASSPPCAHFLQLPPPTGASERVPLAQNSGVALSPCRSSILLRRSLPGACCRPTRTAPGGPTPDKRHAERREVLLEGVDDEGRAGTRHIRSGGGRRGLRRVGLRGRWNELIGGRRRHGNGMVELGKQRELDLWGVRAQHEGERGGWVVTRERTMNASYERALPSASHLCVVSSVLTLSRRRSARKQAQGGASSQPPLRGMPSALAPCCGRRRVHANGARRAASAVSCERSVHRGTSCGSGARPSR